MTSILSTTMRLTNQTLPGVLKSARQAAGELMPFVKSPTPTEALGVNVGELLPATYVGSLMAYNMGKKADEGRPAFPNKDFMALAEAAVTQLIVTKARDAFPYLALGVGMFNMGQAQNKRETLYEAIRAGVLFGTGYLGVNHFGHGYRLAMQQQEATKILADITRLSKKALPEQLLSPELVALERTAKSQVAALEGLAKDKTRSFERITKAIEKFDVAKDRFLATHTPKVNLLPKDAPSNALRELVEVVGNYQAKYLKAARYLHPIMGYFAATTLIGLPLVGVIRRVLAPQRAVAEKEYADNYGSFWLGRTLKGLSEMVGLGNTRYQRMFQQGPYTRNY